MASIWIIENKLLPLAASRLLKPFRVTLFMAANCMELVAPNKASCATCNASGHPGEIRAKETIDAPTNNVLTSKKVSYPYRRTSGAIQGLVIVPAIAAGNIMSPDCNGV
ncbi:hypothetical protein D3C71_1742690 [compost metagenome]